ncbi:type II secretion system F family protein [Streptomyces sp. CBMA152]|uniref:type II secretion system F family protein n=1 Tax=Streptomyces sp. CBMA152 TaxID=1896312 RepID=UPI002948BB7B|nr:type II secretion system F family protein [Streptomyces sp. CBMA152]
MTNWTAADSAALVTPASAAAVCAFAAAWLSVGRDQGLRRARLVLVGAAVEPEEPPWGRLWERLRDRARPEWLCLPVAVVVAVLADSVLPLAAGVVAVPLMGRWLRARERERAKWRRGDEVVAWCGVVAGELRAGRQPGQALAVAARDTEALGEAEAQVLAAARFGGDVALELRVAAREPGAEGLAGVAACWQVAVDGGTGLAAGLERLEAALRADREQQEELRAQLTGPRTTAVLLALLPVLGLLLGTAMGASPLRVLLHTPVGFGCLVVAGALEFAGLCWTARIVRTGEKG